jgi:hypothetical protein
VRISKKDKAEYQRLVKNSKAKVRNTIKRLGTPLVQDIKNGEVVQVDLRDKLKIPAIESFMDRKSFNEWKYETEKFNKGKSSRANFKKNKYGVAVTEHLITSIENLTKKEQKLAIKKKKDMMEKPFVSGGEVQGTLGQRLLTMGKPNNVNIPKNFDFSDIRNITRLKDVFDNKKRRSDPQFYDKRMERMKELYMDSLLLQFNSDAESVIEKIRNIPADDFYELYRTHDEFEILFDPSPQEGFDGQYIDEANMMNQLARIESYVDRYFSGDLNPLFFLRNK